MGVFPYAFNSVPSDLTQAASWLQANFQDAADTAYVDAAVTAGAALTITESGIIIPSGVTTVQHALRNVEAYVQNLEETFEQHHHDAQYGQPGYAARYTSNFDNNISSTAEATLHSTTIVGDGTKWFLAQFTFPQAYIFSGTTGTWSCLLKFDGATLDYHDMAYAATGVAVNGNPVMAVIPPFVGSKTLEITFRNGTAGTSRLIVQMGDASIPSHLSVMPFKAPPP